MDGPLVRNPLEFILCVSIVAALVMAGPLASTAATVLGMISRLWHRISIRRAASMVLELSESRLRTDVSPALRELDIQLRIVLRTIEPVLSRPAMLRDASDFAVDDVADDRFSETIGVTGELWRWLLDAEALLERESTADCSLEDVTRGLRGLLFAQQPLHWRVERMVDLLVGFDASLRRPQPGPGYRAMQADGSVPRVASKAPLDTLTSPRGGSHGEDDERTLLAHQHKFRAVARRYSQDEASSEDLEQEIRIAVWCALPRFRGESSLATYVSRIAHRCGARFARRQPRFTPAAEPCDSSPNQLAYLSFEQQRARAMAAIANLPEGQERALTLQIAGHSYREIGDQLGISESNVSARVSRARARVRRALERAADPNDDA